jgi:hypothetical protein
MFVCFCLRSIKTFKLNFESKYVIFLKKLLCKVSMFFIYRLASTKASQKNRKNWELSFKEIIDDVIIRR